MKALLLTLGTRGDVQPFVALARGLAAAGHDVLLAAPHRFTAFAERHGVPFAGLDDGPMRLMDTGSAVGDVATGGMAAKLALARRLPSMFTQVLDDAWTVTSDHHPDLIIHNGQVMAGQHVAERLGRPAVLGLPIPMFVPTREFPWPGQPMPALMPNRATYLGMKGPSVMFGRTIDRWRASLGLPKRPGRHDPLRAPDGSPAPVLHAISPHVLPRPADWPAAAGMTGYWFLTDPEPRPLPRPLAEFLDAGAPPVFIGFGSMSGTDPAATTATVVAAARQAGVRAVIGTSWGGLTGAGDQAGDVFTVDEVPYEQLFPKVAAVIHHGGAGTIAAAAAAGRPQVVCPFVADQPFWGRHMHRLGVAAEPIHQRALAPDRLAHAIGQVVADPAITTAAERLGRLVRAEDGVGEAVRQLEGIAAPHRR
ncbi:glycosyltransferase [Amycolatopsis albispora]|uniref:Glycosyl transferase n=1 Tax=Amycolatopsis albispora TaxID=1804986 RepID=A0A344L0J3_9PSEU|nr:glycosyltransferase [Amycolatopsis albispora]AXB41567.1 glycosyl transferase [Amycolatopsis albispora]